MHRGMCLPIPAQGKISISTSDFWARLNLLNSKAELKCWRDHLQFTKDWLSFLKSRECPWKTINGRPRGKQPRGASVMQKDNKNSLRVCQLWLQLGDYLRCVALPHSWLYSLGMAMRRSTLGVIGNHFTCFLQPALFILIPSFLPLVCTCPGKALQG